MGCQLKGLDLYTIKRVSAGAYLSMIDKVSKEAGLSPFLDSLWMKSWSDLSPGVALYCVSVDGECVGGFGVSEQTVFKYGIRLCQLFLHRHGSEKYDQVWIEENDVISLPKYTSIVWSALFKVFTDSKADELFVGLSYPIESIESCSYESVIEIESTTYGRTLGDHIRDFDSLLACFSRNTRSQLKRAVKKLPDVVSLDRAENLPHALKMLGWAAEHHKKKWSDSGFLNPSFFEFHKRLISEGLVDGKVELMQFSVGSRVAAVYYYFLQDKSVYFYLGAVNYNDFDDKLKVGLLAHCYAMVHFAGLGFEKYDFLAGEARYKASLSDIQTQQYMYVLSKPSMKQKLIKALKSIKQIITRN